MKLQLYAVNRLERVLQTNHDGGGGRFDIAAHVFHFDLILHVRHNTVSVGTLTEVVGIAGRYRPTGEFRKHIHMLYDTI